MAYFAISLDISVAVVLIILLSSVSGTCLPGFIAESCGKENIALGLKNPSKQQSILHYSSTYGFYNVPNRAFDGNLRTEFVTRIEQNPFLWVDLGSVHSLHTMALYTRLSSVSRAYVLTNFMIEVDRTGQFSTPDLCYHYTGTKHFEIHNITCNQPLQGQYVRIQVQANQSLIIRELEIFGVCLPGFSGENCQKQNIALGLKNSSKEQSIFNYSSTYGPNNSPNLAFDGHLHTEFATIDEQNPFMWVNLGSVHSLHTMALYTRLSSLSPTYVLTNFTIEVDSTGQFSTPDLCYHYTGAKHFEIHNITCNQPLRGQYIKIHVQAQQSLIIREFEIYGVGLCLLGFSGENCEKGLCSLGFSGEKCQKENIAFGLKNTPIMPGILHNSSVYNEKVHNLKLAFDGHLETEFATKYEHNPFMWINLSSVQSLHTMTLYTRLNAVSPGYVLTNFTIEVDKTSQFSTPAVCYHYTGTKHLEVHNIMCNQPLQGQYVRIQVHANQSLIIRELEIHECVNGYFGAACDKCGKCRNSESCDKITGKCPKGCDLGIAGDLCKTECDEGTYGYNCVNKCGICESNTVCDKKNGTCPRGCNHGFTGRLCKECADGYYGISCLECGLCRNGVACDKTNGECPDGCDPGRQGIHCQKECSEGRYGGRCSGRCGRCRENVACDTNTGYCNEGCIAGYEPPLCQSECLDGSYGANCQFVCGRCPDNSSCDKVNGTCPAIDGNVKSENGKTTIGYVAGICILAALLAVTTILMLVFYFQKQRYLKLYLDLDSTRYASYEKENGVDVSDVVYEQPN